MKVSMAATLVAAVVIGGTARITLAQQSPSRTASPLTELSAAFEDLSRRVSPAVVQVWVSALAPVRVGAGRGVTPVLGRERRSGSGLLVSADGYILTNAHVVEGARRLAVVLARPAATDAPGRSILKPIGERVEAQLVGVDRETDLAVLKIVGIDLPHLELADSDSLRAGHLVLAFGSPLGLESSVTMGVVSAVGRQLEPDHPMVYIQTDAPINPGNSGGPLVDTEGRVVGINTLIFSRSGGSEGIGFAAPSNIARAVFEQIRDAGRVRRGVIGVNAQTITPTLAAGLRLSQGWGVVISDVYPRSPAARAGLQPGDVIVSLNGKAMENARQFDVNVYRRTGSVINLDIRRGLQRFGAQVLVVERDDDPARVADLVSRDRNLIAELGVLALDVNEEIARMLPWLRRTGGVAIAGRAAGAPRVDTGLEPGDVIYAVNGQAVSSLSQLLTLLGALDPGDAVVMHVDRRGALRYFAFEIQ
jgi:serine protease Do